MAISLAGFLILNSSPLQAQTFEPTLTVGAGIQTGYDHTEPATGTSQDQFQLDHLRLYFSGDITKNFSAMVNTEYSSGSNNIGVLDAVGEFHTSPMLNIWFGRFLPPSDRANLYGPFYANEWAVYTDGIQDGYPFVSQGRDNGVAYWGDFKAGPAKMKFSAGAFDGNSADGIHSIIWAARAQFDFWDPEGGYYLNGTYYGDKNLLAIGGATEVQAYKTATTVDFLMEKKVMHGGAIGIESEYSRYNRLGGYNGNYSKSEGGYGLVSVLFPKPVGVGKVQAIGKFAIAEFTGGIGSPVTNPSYRQKTTEVDLGYIVKQFDARFYAFGKTTSFNQVQTNFWDAGIGLQFQLSKQILGKE
ncbi:MAG TPA: hypothetical protein VFE02_08490 [Candidatus Acidoferrales bacterium]|nr:hypothetical protein [Candidatus Acidoferrales bacterium]